MLPISVCIISKNEESHMGECLKHLSLLDWEIIIVDTGSTDRTVEIASLYTSHIYHFNWCNDFSAARNYAVSKASYDWILSVDCDEYLEDLDISLFQTWQAQYCNGSTDFLLGRFTIKNILSLTDEEEYTTESVTRFFNRNYYHFQGAIHEQLAPLVDCSRLTLDIPLSFCHMGYLSPQIRHKKAERNILLLLEQIRNSAPSCYLYYQLGQCYFSVQKYEEARHYYEQALELLVFPFPEYVQTLIESYGYTLLELHQNKLALNLLSQEFYQQFSHHADYVFLAGLIYMNNGLLDKAINEFNAAAQISSHRSEGVNSFKAYYNIGVIYECTGNISTAISYYTKCGSYAPALDRLSILKNHS